MAITKNFGLAGVGSDVQLGKGGGRFVFAGGTFKFTTDGSTLTTVQGATPVTDSDLANKAYVDSMASGLDPKASVRVATTANLSATYSAGGGTAGTGGFSSATNIVDGVTLVNGNRVLVKDQTTQTQNGIYVVVTVGTGANGIWERASDFDGTPATEISGGNYAFVEQGTQSNSGWVLQGNGTLTLNSDNLTWVQFTGAGQITAGAGLTKTGDTLNVGTASASRIVVNADNIDLATTGVGAASYGSATQVATFTVDAYGRNTASASVAIAIPSTQVTDFTEAAQDAAGAMASTAGVGVDLVYNDAGNTLTANLDVNGLSTVTLATGDQIPFYDTSGTTHGKVTIDALATYINANSNDNIIAAGDSSITVTDAGTGNIVVAVDGSTVSTTTTSGEVIAAGKTLTVTDLGAARVVYTGTAGVLTSEANFAYTAASDTLAVGSAGTGTITTGNLSLTGNTFSSSTGNIIINPAGAGVVQINTGAATVTSASAQPLTIVAGTGGSLTIAGGANAASAGGILTLSGGDTSGAGAGGNTIIRGGNSTSGTDGVIKFLDANGTAEILEMLNNPTGVNHLSFIAGSAGNNALISSNTTGAETNAGISFTTKGTGTLRITNAGYENNVLNDNDIPNKKYVDTAINAATPVGGITTLTAAVNFASATAQAVGILPANATVLRITLKVNTISTAATTVTLGDATNGAAAYMTAIENDPQVAGVYVADGFVTNGGSPVTVNATVGTAGASGSGTVIVEFRQG